MRAVLVVGIVTSRIASADSSSIELTGALTVGKHHTTRELSCCDHAPDATGTYVDGELGARLGPFGVTAFVRYAQYHEDVGLDFPENGGRDWWIHDQDLVLGVRVHAWPCRWFRVAFGAGLMREHELDQFDDPSATATTTPKAFLTQWQAAIAIPTDSRVRLEITADFSTWTYPGTRELTEIGAIGIGARL